MDLAADLAAVAAADTVMAVTVMAAAADTAAHSH